MYAVNLDLVCRPRLLSVKKNQKNVRCPEPVELKQGALQLSVVELENSRDVQRPQTTH